MCGAKLVGQAQRRWAESSWWQPEKQGKQDQAKKHPGAQERAQEEDHHKEEAFNFVKVGVSKHRRWWYRFKMPWQVDLDISKAIMGGLEMSRNDAGYEEVQVQHTVH